MVQAVIFDIDGTLIDTVDLHAAAWREALAHFGYDVAYEAVRHQIGKGGDQLLPVFVPEADLGRRGEEIETFRGDLFRSKYLPQAKPFPEVRALFERLRADGRRRVLATSSKAGEAERYQHIADIEDLVDAVVTRDDAAHSKPCPDIFEAALEKLSPLPAGQAVAVGDSPYDAIAACRAGLRTIGVLSGGFAEAELREAGCIAVYAGPAELLARYDAWALGL